MTNGGTNKNQKNGLNWTVLEHANLNGHAEIFKLFKLARAKKQAGP
jgi:hypothetical protein